MKTPRDLLFESKKLTQDNYFLALFKRLLFEMLNDQSMDLYKDMDKGISDTFAQNYFDNVSRLLNDEPLGHVLGYEWFYGLKLFVSSDVLIPRSETEELAGYVSADIFDYFDESIDIVDVATGSGALACALKSDHPKANVVATDISEQALAIATKNASNNKLDITFYQGDMANPLIDKNLLFDVVVCNPPYIKKSEEIEASVIDFEPHVALFGGEDGLDLYRKILDQLPMILKSKALVAFEIGFDQKETLLLEINKRFKDVLVECKKDINQKDRMIFIYFNITPA